MTDSLKEFLADVPEAGAAPEPAKSGFAAFVENEDQAGQIGFAVEIGAKKAPEAAARILDLSQRTGLPQEAVEKQTDFIEQKEKRAAFDPVAFQKATPGIAGWLAENPNHAALVQDELPAVAKIEETIQDHSLMETMGLALAGGFARLGASAAKTPAFVYDAYNLMPAASVRPGVIPGFEGRAPRWLRENTVAKYLDERADKLNPPELDQSIIDNARAGNYAKAGRILAAKFVANAPQQAAIIAATLTGYGIPALAAAGLLTGAEAAAEGAAAGADPQAATSNAILQGAAEAAFERVGTFGILKHWEAAIAKSVGKQVARQIYTDFGKTLAYAFVAEGNEEFWTEGAQGLSDYLTGVNPAALDGLLARMTEAGVVGAASGGVLTGPSAIGAGTARALQMRRAEKTKEFYTALGASLEATKARERLPDATRAIVERLTKDSPVEKVYIEPEAIETYFQGKKIDPAVAMREIGVLEAYEAAKDSGSQVEVPLSVWTEKVVGTEHYAGLADDIAFAPEALSVNQAKALKEQIQEEEAAAAEAEPVEDDGAKVAAAVTEQLKAAGVEEGTASTYATIYENAFRTLGERAGMDPVELFNRYGLKITREGLDSPASQAVKTTKFDENVAAAMKDEGLVDDADRVVKLLAKYGGDPRYVVAALDKGVEAADNFFAAGEIPVDLPELTEESLPETKYRHSPKKVRELAKQLRDTAMADWQAADDDSIVKRIKRIGRIKITPEYERIGDLATQFVSNYARMEILTRTGVGKSVDEMADALGMSDTELIDAIVNEGKLRSLKPSDKVRDYEEPAREEMDRERREKDLGKAQEKAVRDALPSKVLRVMTRLGIDVDPANPNVLLQSPVGQPQPTQQDPLAPAGIDPGPEAGLESVFPQTDVTSLPSIADHPDFRQLTSDAFAVVKFHAQQRGVPATHDLARSLFQEFHDELGRIMRAPAAERVAVAAEIKAKYPDIEREFSTLRDKLWVDDFEIFFTKNVAGQYGSMRPAVATETTLNQELFDVPAEPVNKRFERYVKEAAAAGMDQGQAQREAFKKLAAEKQEAAPAAAPKTQQMELGAGDGVAGFGRGRQGETELFQAALEEYAGGHRPPGRDSGAPGHDITGGGGIYPADIYGPRGAEYYGHYGQNHPLDLQTMAILRGLRGRPNASVKIYRAIPDDVTPADKIAKLQKQKAYILKHGKIPPGVETNLGHSAYYEKIANELTALESQPEAADAELTINPGDWVTVNRAYAREHGESTLLGNYKILSKTVRANEIFTDGNSIHEFGYWPKGTEPADQPADKPNSPTILFQSAYHGTPHKFDKFDLSKIGTGEGAQAYGWGLYFAGTKEVADYYRQNVLDKKALDEINERLSALSREMDPYRSGEYGKFKDPKGYELMAEYNRLIDERGQMKGRLYKVEIPEDSEFLDWDANLSDQNDKVKAAVRAALKAAKYLGKNDDGPRQLQSAFDAAKIELGGMSGSSDGAFVVDVLETLLQDGRLKTPAGGTTSTGRINAEKAASLYLNSFGVPGTKYLDINSRAKGAKKLSHNYVIFDAGAVQILEYEQSERGRIRFTRGGGSFNIDLLKNADLSTVLHETGHLYLEILGDLATMEGAAPNVQADFKTILDWFGVESREEIETNHHELFARGFEAYLMEGKAPSAALRQAFSKFRAWLVSIYRTITNLDVQLTPDVKAVFDRMLASEEAIRQAEADQRILPLFTDPAAIGMTPEQAGRYNKAITDARLAAEEELTGRLMNEVLRERKAWWADEKEKIRKEVEAEVDQEPEQIAMAVLQTGKLPGGKPLPEGMEPVKLSKDAITKQYDYNTRSFPRPYIYAAEGGIHPDEAAQLFGFQSGAQLLFQLVGTENRDDKIKRVTDERMAERHGSMLTDGSLIGAAMKAVHNQKRSQLFHMELEHLANNNLPAFKGIVRRMAKRLPPLDAVREQAERAIAAKRVRDIQPILYQRAQTKAAAEAMDAFLKGDVEAAFAAKQRELLNHELYRAAAAAVETVDKMVDYARKFNRPSVRERIGKAGGDYLDQIDGILERFDFRRGVSLRTIDKRKALVEWIREQQEAGFDVNVPPALLNEAYSRHYKEVPFEELVGIRESLESIEHLARLKNDLLKNERLRTLQAARDEIVASIAANHEIKAEPVDFAPTLGKRIAKKARGVIAGHTRMEFLFEWLDGNKPAGAAWTTLFKPVVEAENAENTMMREVVASVRRIFGAYSKKERIRWFFDRTFIPEINSSMTKANMLAVALNLGNEYNSEALLAGYGWTPEQVQAITSRLDERDWNTVQAIWDYIDSFWPQVESLEKRLNGVAPEKVKAQPVQTPFGVLRGGYYPIVFDAELSWRQGLLEEKANVADMFGGQWARAMTRHGHTKQRTNTGGKPIRLELSGLTNHLANVVHDLTHRETVIDLNRIIQEPDIRAAIIGSAGRDMYRQLNPWLTAIAGERRGEYANPMEGILGRARSGATVVSLGWKLTSSLAQTLGYLVSIKELGPKYAALGLNDAFGKPWEFGKKWNFITERSEAMRDRMNNFDRDVRDAMKRLNVAGQPGVAGAVEAYAGPVRETFFSLIGFMDLGTAVPTWLAAYRKAMDGKQDGINAGDEPAAIDFADKTVRTTQGAGSPKDLAAVQRGDERWKLFTMFYSQLSVVFNQFEKTFRQYQMDRNKPRLIASMALLWFLPAVLEELIRGRGPDDEDEWLAWAGKKELTFPFQTVILLRDVVNGMDEYGYNPSPAFDAFKQLSRVGGMGLKLATGEKEEIGRADVKAAALVVGYFAQLPSRQVWSTLEYLYDWITGEEEPANVAEGAWRALVTGKPRD